MNPPTYGYTNVKELFDAVLQAQDLDKLVLLGTPAVHPVDRSQAVIAKAGMSWEHDVYISRLMLYDMEDGIERPLLPEEAQAAIQQDHSPRWSPDGERLAFLRKVQGSDELWLYDRAAGTVRCLTPKRKVKSFTFSPDGRKLVYMSRVNEGDAAAYRITRMRYKFDGEGMTNGYTQLFLIDLEHEKTEQLTTRRSDHSTPVFTADGSTLIYTSDYPEDDDLDKFPTLHRMDLATREEASVRPDVKSVTALFPMSDGTLVGLGKRHMAESTEIDKWFHIQEHPSQTEWAEQLPELHIGTHLISDSKRPGSMRTAIKRGDKFVFIATYEGMQSLYVLDWGADGTAVSRIPIPLNVVSFDVASCDDQSCDVLFVGDSLRKPGELYRAVWRYGDEVELKQLTDYHADFMERLPDADIREYRVRCADGLTVQGWSIQAHVGHDGMRLPRSGTQLWIHGGPHLAYGDVFHYDFWYWVSLGYRVIFCNPRGSTGYGQAFASAVLGEWGRRDVDDLYRFMEQVLTEEGRGTEESLYVLGGSYGGYLVNWIIGHDDRFRAAVTERSICNLYSKIGNSDNGFYNSLHQLGGDKDLWTDEETIMAMSPIRYVPQVKTPVLIIHGEQDHRCPIEQAEQWYTALRRLGKDTAFLRLPGASHAYATAGRPKQRAARLQAIQEWLDEHR